MDICELDVSLEVKELSAQISLEPAPGASDVTLEVEAPFNVLSTEVITDGELVLELEAQPFVTTEVGVIVPTPTNQIIRRDYAFTVARRAPSNGDIALGRDGVPLTSVPLLLERECRIVGASVRLDRAGAQPYNLSVEDLAGNVLATVPIPVGIFNVLDTNLSVAIPAGLNVLVWLRRASGVSRSTWRNATAILTLNEV